MANEEHLARLKQGVAAWNQWRDENRGIQPDLGKADLSGAYLSGVHLREAILSGARLCETNSARRILNRTRLEMST